MHSWYFKELEEKGAEMKGHHYILLLGMAAAAGGAAGMLSNRNSPAKGGLIGATAGVVFGSLAAGLYQHLSSDGKVPYYSESSSLYEDGPTV